MSQLERMQKGLIYNPNDEFIITELTMPGFAAWFSFITRASSQSMVSYSISVAA